MKQLFRSERRRIPEGHPLGWDHLSIPDEGWAAPTPVDAVEEVPDTGWATNEPEEGFTTIRGRSVSSRRPLDEPSSLLVAPDVLAAPVNNVPDSTSDAHLEGMRKILRVMGNVPEGILNSNNKYLILALFQGRMSQGHNGGDPGGSPGS